MDKAYKLRCNKESRTIGQFQHGVVGVLHARAKRHGLRLYVAELARM